MNDLNLILGCFQAAHSVLNLAWPRPGVPGMTGASAFLGTNVLKGFRTALLKAAPAIAELPADKLRETIAAAVGESLSLLDRIELKTAKMPQEAFDSAINLLYFVTGAAWHLVSEHEAHVRALPGGPMNVEAFDQLCRVCRREENTDSPSESVLLATRHMQALQALVRQ